MFGLPLSDADGNWSHLGSAGLLLSPSLSLRAVTPSSVPSCFSPSRCLFIPLGNGKCFGWAVGLCCRAVGLLAEPACSRSSSKAKQVLLGEGVQCLGEETRGEMSIMRVILGAQCDACNGHHGGRSMESQSPAAPTVRSALSSCLYSWGHKNSWVTFLAGLWLVSAQHVGAAEAAQPRDVGWPHPTPSRQPGAFQHHPELGYRGWPPLW